MKKIIIINAVALLLGFGVTAQDKKVAVFEPVGSANSAVKEIIREEISSAVVNASGYTVLERQMITKVLEENKFQASGLVDNSQVSKMGRLMGASFAFITNVTPLSEGNYHISCKLIDVQTGRIERQQTARTERGTSDVMDVAQEMVGKMLDTAEKKPVRTANAEGSKTSQPNAQNRNQQQASMSYAAFTQLRNNDDAMEAFLKKNDEELYRQFDKGASLRQKGKVLLGVGLGVTAASIALMFAGAETMSSSSYEPYGSYESSSSGDGELQFLAGYFGLFVGQGLIIASIPLSAVGGSLKKRAANNYEEKYFNSRTSYQPSLHFGVTQSGVGLALNF